MNSPNSYTRQGGENAYRFAGGDGTAGAARSPPHAKLPIGRGDPPPPGGPIAHSGRPDAGSAATVRSWSAACATLTSGAGRSAPQRDGLGPLSARVPRERTGCAEAPLRRALDEHGAERRRIVGLACGSARSESVPGHGGASGSESGSGAGAAALPRGEAGRRHRPRRRGRSRRATRSSAPWRRSCSSHCARCWRRRRDAAARRAAGRHDARQRRPHHEIAGTA